MSHDINELRSEIDKIDLGLLDLIEQRMAVSRKIGICKREMGKDILDTSREADKLASLQANAGFESREYIDDIYRTIFEVSRDHQKKPCFGLLGRTLGHSYSPQIHSLFTSDYSYTLIEREPEELDELFASRIYGGFNVTIPYKKEAFARCDVTDGASTETGSVNTVVFGEDGKIYGYNTDYYGFMYMLRSSGIDPSGKKCLILGTGGAACAVLYGLKTMNAGDIKSCDLETEINYSNVYDICKDAQIIVNCTPVGMYPKVDGCVIDLDKFSCLEAVADVVYNPSRTKLLQEASKRGLKTAGGLSMLVAQAYKSSRFFVGDNEGAEMIDEAAEEAIAGVVRKLESQMRNITIIGMPGCGKSMLARRLAARTGRPLVDLDAAYTEKIGETPAETIKAKGEEAFRLNETEVAKEYLVKSGMIISCGGGIVTQPRNDFYLKCNSNVIYLDRPLEMLASKDRPLTQANGVEKLYEQRHARYEELADIRISLDRFESKTDFFNEAVKIINKGGVSL
ncbi:shikimate dehydrogenase [Ruminococcaceae bacterium YRB3002]|nr:shikimate dehydrogenase [Ruminococcaceae bacterium YRB3002]